MKKDSGNPAIFDRSTPCLQFYKYINVVIVMNAASHNLNFIRVFTNLTTHPVSGLFLTRFEDLSKSSFKLNTDSPVIVK